MEDASPQLIRGYLDSYPNTPLADRLRTEWLKFLGRRALWSRFGADYAPPASDDVELACFNVLFKWHRDGDGALADALPLWFTGSATPDACEPAFAALIAKGTITPADRRARFRLASEAGNVKLAQALGSDLRRRTASPTLEFDAVNRDPLARARQRQLRVDDRERPRPRAVRARARGAQRRRRRARRMGEVARPPARRAIACTATAASPTTRRSQLHPSANDWYREAGDTAASPEAQAWRVRAALRALAWDDVIARDRRHA